MWIKSFARAFDRFVSEEEGQGTVEYVLILSVVVVAASQLGRQILQALDKGILRLGGELEKDLKTGRAGLSAWKN